MKGIILAGGKGTRLFPTTLHISKQLLPVYDKPMIYYSLSILMLAGINEIAIISDKFNLSSYQSLLKDGSQLGISLVYYIQDKPNGLPEAFIIAKDFIHNNNVALILGDNVFYGRGFGNLIKTKISAFNQGATIFPYYVNNPSEFGIVDFINNKIINLVEKPENPSSNYAIPGLYFFDKKVLEKTYLLKPSKRGELEIIDLLNLYLSDNSLDYELIGRGVAWLDTGSFEGIAEASLFVRTIQKRTGLYVSCIEEISYRNRWISKEQLLSFAANYKNEYGKYLISVAEMQL
jgi:glucose-1-phosphate thymidylyltransferase